MTWGFGDEPALGIRISLALCYHVGFRTKERLCEAVAIMTAESARHPEAWHENWSHDEFGEPKELESTDRGLFQINSKWHPDLSDADAYQPIPNAAYAAKISDNGRVWAAWATFHSGAYQRFLPEIEAIWVQGDLWRPKIEKVERRLG